MATIRFVYHRPRVDSLTVAGHSDVEHRTIPPSPEPRPSLPILTAVSGRSTDQLTKPERSSPTMFSGTLTPAHGSQSTVAPATRNGGSGASARHVTTAPTESQKKKKKKKKKNIGKTQKNKHKPKKHKEKKNKKPQSSNRTVPRPRAVCPPNTRIPWCLLLALVKYPMATIYRGMVYKRRRPGRPGDHSCARVESTTSCSQRCHHAEVEFAMTSLRPSSKFKLV
ncbi:hypothetical protein B0H66DRAFT_372275 [Apodospora peruviana]|uniref:Uncharacterized protein n=1 Tax=Apodospora peruviana TaxID=516989 RepID=A0AAE0M091_9PEZI|nr:hypothetical protein B0H66DRAFT_372275 [Apodospora peruviana]